MIVSSSGGDFKPIPEGSYIAICIRVIDLGTQVTTYKGADKTQKKVLIVWEVPEVQVEYDGVMRPALIMSRYTASLSDKANLRRDLESWRGKRFTDEELKGFDLKVLVGHACQIQVLHSEDGAYANVRAIMAMPKGMDKPVPEHPTIHFSLDAGEYSQGIFESLSEKLQAQIKLSPEWKALNGGEPLPKEEEHFTRDMDDEIPF